MPEIQAALGWGEYRTRMLLRDLVRQGRIEVGQYRSTNVWGRMQWAPYYALKVK